MPALILCRTYSRVIAPVAGRGARTQLPGEVIEVMPTSHVFSDFEHLEWCVIEVTDASVDELRVRLMAIEDFNDLNYDGLDDDSGRDVAHRRRRRIALDDLALRLDATQAARLTLNMERGTRSAPGEPSQIAYEDIRQSCVKSNGGGGADIPAPLA